MRGFPSSTFSFDTLQLNDRPPIGFRRGVLFAVLLLALAEASARAVIPAVVGDKWKFWSPEAAVTVEQYRRRIEEGREPRITIVGDSTGARNVDPLAMAAASPRLDAYNLALDANYPRAFRLTTLPLLRTDSAPGSVIVASFDPAGFFGGAAIERLEDEILESPYCRGVAGMTAPTDYLYLLRFDRALTFMRDSV